MGDSSSAMLALCRENQHTYPPTNCQKSGRFGRRFGLTMLPLRQCSVQNQLLHLWPRQERLHTAASEGWEERCPKPDFTISLMPKI